MNTKELKPHLHADVLRAIADGHLSDIECRHLPEDQWFSWSECLTTTFNPITYAHWQWRVKPKTHWINGIECPAPLKALPKDGSPVFVADPCWLDRYSELPMENVHAVRLLNLGLAHSTKDAAIANAKAMLAFKDAP